jgi:hypothetical protein
MAGEGNDMSAARRGPTASVGCIGDLIHVIGTRVSAEKRVLWFRGQRSASWDVAPLIWREYDREAERNFTNRFRARAGTRHQTLPSYDDSGMWLSLMQHYGLPTRLLDWTRSPLIALYFALEKYVYERSAEPQDAVVWILEPHRLNKLEELGDVTPSIDAHTCAPMLTPAFTHWDKEKNRIFEENHKVLAAMAAEKDVRMFVQQGCFTIHSDQRPLNKREGHESYLSRIMIPAESVKQMAFEIDVCGFRKGDLFPDLGHLADELKVQPH